MTDQPSARNQTPPATAPGPRGLPIVGSAFALARDPHLTLLRARERYGDVVRFSTPTGDVFLLSHPNHIAHVLQDRARDYPKSQTYDLLKPLLGNGLLTNSGESWLQQRRLAQPAFHRARLAGFAAVMTGRAEALAARWALTAAIPRNIAADMLHMTLEIVGQTLFSVDLSGDAPLIGTAVTEALEVCNDRFNALAPLPTWLPTPANRRFDRAVTQLHRIVDDVIAARRFGQPADDLLTMLLEARDAETGAGMSDRQLRDEVLTLIVAGHETTANALAWASYLLATHPTVERRLLHELATVLAGRTPTLTDLPQLPYTAMVVDEVLRLYPPAWTFDHTARCDDVIDGFRIPAGSLMLLSPYVTHRHPELWEQPEGFDPERFDPARATARQRLAYFPFGAGQRICIGNNFAHMEMQLILATLVQRTHLELIPDHPVEPDPQITLRPRYGIQMRPYPRVSGAPASPDHRCSAPSPV